MLFAKHWGRYLNYMPISIACLVVCSFSRKLQELFFVVVEDLQLFSPLHFLLSLKRVRVYRQRAPMLLMPRHVGCQVTEYYERRGATVCISDLAEMQKRPQERSPLHFLAFLLNQSTTQPYGTSWQFQFNHCYKESLSLAWLFLQGCMLGLLPRIKTLLFRVFFPLAPLRFKFISPVT